MSTATVKEQAEAEARRANAKLHAIRDAERYEENKHLVGKTFRFRNNFSCPEKPSDYWWLYKKVQKVDKEGMLTIFSFEIDKYGSLTVRIEDFQYSVVSGAQPISSAEFNKKWRGFQKRIAAAKP